MGSVMRWVRSHTDIGEVSYSRFGLPGDETDDKPPPQQVHVAAFHENASEFRFGGAHSTRAAVFVCGLGMSVCIFMFISVFFEFDWVDHRKGVDFAAFFGLIAFLVCGVTCHWLIIMSMRDSKPLYLLPFIIIYSVIIGSEVLFMLLSMNHWVAIQYLENRNTRAFAATMIFVAVVVAVQSCMLAIVVRVRNFLSKKNIHMQEMRVAEQCRIKYPGLRIVFGRGGDEAGSSDANRPFTQTPTPPSGADESPRMDAPPPYDSAVSAGRVTMEDSALAPSPAKKQ